MRITVFLTLLILINLDVKAQYYVDYENGNDFNNGTATESAWQHCPGDVNATGIPASIKLVAGDKILFKSDVTYRGSISAIESGSVESPIVYSGNEWSTTDEARAIITGTQRLNLSWSVADQVDINGNTNNSNIYKAILPAAYNFSENQFFVNDERIYIAQDPNPEDPFWNNTHDDYRTVTNSDLTLSSIVDVNYFTQTDADFWDDSYIMIWGNPNSIFISKITGYIVAENRIVFEELPDNSIYADGRDQYYSVINNPFYIDTPVEYTIDEGSNTIYYWPEDDINTINFSVSNISKGIDLAGHSNITIKGFKIYGYTSEGAAHAIVNSKTWDAPAENIIIKENEIYSIKTKNGKKGSIQMNNVYNLLIEDNLIRDNQRNSGILSNASNIIIR